MRFNYAIALTLSRVVLAPFFAWAFIAGYSSGSPAILWIAVIILTVMELTDTFDGQVARACGMVTDFGKLCDPLADSLARQTVFLSFLMCGIIPLWMSLVFLYRDSILSTLRTMIAVNGTVQAAKTSGKLKAVLQAVGSFGVVLVCLAHSYGWFGIPALVWNHHPGYWIMLVPVAITVLSMFDYLIPSRGIIRRMMTPKI